MSQAGSIVIPICLVLTDWERRVWRFVACAFALILPSSRPVGVMIDIQASLLAIIRENAFNPSWYTPIKLTFAVYDSHMSKRTLRGADPQQRVLRHWPCLGHHIQYDIPTKFHRDPFITCYFGWLLRRFQVSPKLL